MLQNNTLIMSFFACHPLFYWFLCNLFALYFALGCMLRRWWCLSCPNQSILLLPARRRNFLYEIKKTNKEWCICDVTMQICLKKTNLWFTSCHDFIEKHKRIFYCFTTYNNSMVPQKHHLKHTKITFNLEIIINKQQLIKVL